MANDSKISTIDDAPDEATKPVASKSTTTAKRAVKVDGHDIALSGKKLTITIHASELENGHDAVPIGLNGYMYQVPRGIPVEVPEELVGILKNAQTTSYHPGRDGTLIERTTNRFAFSTH